MKTPWPEVMAGLRGPRLAVYDDILNGVSVAANVPLIQNVIGWLVFHRFVRRDEAGRLIARTTNDARGVWQTEGPARDAGQAVEEPDTPPAAPAPVQSPDAGLPAAVAVHVARPSQPDLFP